MISIPLPPVFMSGGMSIGEILEAHAMTYWSKYNTLPISARVLQSMQRAWGVVDATMYPRVASVNCGMVAARIGTGGVYKLVIGIEGAQTVGNIVNTLQFLEAVTVPGCQGHIVNFVKSALTACQALPVALTVVADALANPRIPVTFCGHSLGGAVAEVWAFVLKAAMPTRTVKYISFGSPRVGSRAWVGRKNPGVRFAHVYTDGDIMHLVPQDAGIIPFAITNPNLALGYAAYVRENVCWRWNKNASRFAGLPENPYYSRPTWYLNQLSAPMVPENPFYKHQSDYYRLVMMALASVSGPELKYRYTNMEFENENQWQALYRLGSDLSPSFNNLLVPGPDAVVPPNNEILALAGVAPPIVQPQGQIDPINLELAPDRGEGGGDWGAAPVIQTQLLPQRRVRSRQ